MSAKKFYVVWKGIRPGVYETWKECEAQIRGVEGAVYKSFPDRATANKALNDGWMSYIGMKKEEKAKKQRSAHEAIQESISVDAACSGNPGELEYRGVETRTGRQLFHQGPFPLGTVNIGEFLAIVHALAYLQKHGSGLPVYSDSRTAIKWTRDKAIKTNLPRNSTTEALFELVDRALHWLKTHQYTNKVLKWETAQWGEIPADFGRK